MGQQPCLFGCSPPLPLLPTCQLCSLFGLSSPLFLLPTRQFLGLVRGFRLGSLISLDLGPGALSVALLFFAALFLALVAFGHSAHRIQVRRQGLGSHTPLRQDLLATRLHGAHRHDPSHEDTLFSPPRALLRQGGPSRTALLAGVAPLFFPLGFLLLGLQLPSQQNRLLHHDGQDQPQSARPFWLRHLGVFPMKPSPLAVFVLILNPKSQLIPGRFRFGGRQVAHCTDRLLIALLPAHEHRALHPLSFLTPFSFT